MIYDAPKMKTKLAAQIFFSQLFFVSHVYRRDVKFYILQLLVTSRSGSLATFLDTADISCRQGA